MDENVSNDVQRDHERDFVGWTERQASVLRRISSGTFGLDTNNLAEEIEDLGRSEIRDPRSEIREVSSLLRQILVHLIKLAAARDAQPARHRMDEVMTFQGDAVLACSPGIRQRVDLAAIWKLACNAATRPLMQHGITLDPLPAVCPLSIDQLLDTEFDPVQAVSTILISMKH